MINVEIIYNPIQRIRTIIVFRTSKFHFGRLSLISIPICIQPKDCKLNPGMLAGGDNISFSLNKSTDDSDPGEMASGAKVDRQMVFAQMNLNIRSAILFTASSERC